MNDILSALKSSLVTLGGKALPKDSYQLEIGEEGVFLTAEKAEYVRLTFAVSLDGNAEILGDAFERTYGDVCFLKKADVIGKILPWYMMAKIGDGFDCFGVSVRPNAFCYWQVYENEIALTYNVCSGADPVELGGRRLSLGRIVTLEKQGDFLTVGRAFCKLMCRDGIFPKHRVYGGNNWYYAYGKSSDAEILEDADYLAELTEGIENRPYFVIDDCWEKNICAGPWDELNPKFSDMRALAERIKEKDLHPGIWIRPLCYIGCGFPKEWILRKDGDGIIPDVTVPEAKKQVLSAFRLMKDWGFELVKYDYVFYDFMGSYAFGFDITEGCGKYHFHDRSRTTAEVMTEWMREVKETVGKDVLLIGCNTPSHLSAGLVEISRTGDDTSGREWERTAKMGINTLCYRIIQDGIFYACDADCVGYTEKVPAEKNAVWLTLLAKSNTPLFLSSKRGVADEKEKEFIKECFRENNKTHEFIPYLKTNLYIPNEFLIDGERYTFDVSSS